MGERGAGRLRVLRQGSALHHQPPRARGGRRLHQLFFRLRRARARRPARAGSVAVRAHQEIRRGRLRGFLELLPQTLDGRALRHVVEVRHDSFRTPAFVALLRRFKCRSSSPTTHDYPAIADVVGDFVYARLQKGEDTVDRLPGARARRLDAAPARLGRGRRARRPRSGRAGATTEAAARRVRVFHPRGEGARARRRDGDDRAVALHRG